MNNKSNIVIGAIAVIALLVGGLAYHKAPLQVSGKAGQVGIQGPKGDRGPAGLQGETGAQGIKGADGQSGHVFGATATLDNVDNPFVSIGGVKTYYYSRPMTATSSIICSIQNPFNATSTVLTYGAYARASTFVAAETMSLSTSTSAFASSTQNYVLDFSAPAGQGFAFAWNLLATTSARVIGSMDVNSVPQYLNVLKPGEWLNLRISTSTPGVGGAYTGGLCKGVIQSIGN